MPSQGWCHLLSLRLGPVHAVTSACGLQAAGRPPEGPQCERGSCAHRAHPVPYSEVPGPLSTGSPCFMRSPHGPRSSPRKEQTSL